MESAPKKKQRVIVTFIDEEEVFDDLPIGILSKYADSQKRLLEEGAIEKYIYEEKDRRFSE